MGAYKILQQINTDDTIPTEEEDNCGQYRTNDRFPKCLQLWYYLVVMQSAYAGNVMQIPRCATWSAIVDARSWYGQITQLVRIYRKQTDTFGVLQCFMNIGLQATFLQNWRNSCPLSKTSKSEFARCPQRIVTISLPKVLVTIWWRTIFNDIK